MNSNDNNFKYILEKLNNENYYLRKELDELVNIVEISKYVNRYLANENLIDVINDMILGVLGVTYSTIYLYEKNKLVIKSTNFNVKDIVFPANILKCITLKEKFIINSENIFPPNSDKKNIHSIVGVPINIRENSIGYIIVEHSLINFFEDRHIKFIESICNQIGIAIENSLLYVKMQESYKRDSLLNIYTRKYFFELMDEKILKNKLDPSYSIIMIDLDNFKEVNYKRGYKSADKALIESLEFIKRFTSKQDIIARYCGDRIIIYKKFDKPEEVMATAMAIKKCFNDNVIKYENDFYKLTASFGLAFYPKDANSLHNAIKLADKFLASAKIEGRNKIMSSYKLQ